MKKQDPRIPFNESYYSARSDNGEWYTPSPIIESVRMALDGTIDLDPFSCDVAQATVKATQYFTRERSALTRSWPSGRTLFANPPYARTLIGQCIHRVVMEYRYSWNEGIVLVNNATDTTWFQQIAEISASMCIFKRRIQFDHPQDVTVDRNTRGQIALYIGGNRQRFRSAFADLGIICDF